MLDAYMSFADSDILYQRFWGNSNDPSKSESDFQKECEKHLLDQINRCLKEFTEATSKGTAFNELVDMIIHKRRYPSIEMTVEPYYDKGFFEVLIDGFLFRFSMELCNVVASKFPDAISQYRCQADLQVNDAIVTLYGYLDEWVGCHIFDIKTCKNYSFGDYERKSQRHLYPFCLIESGDCNHIEDFTFTVVNLFKPDSKTSVINGKVYNEVYTYNHEQSRLWLKEHCENFISWLESRKSFITDKRIFGLDNPPNYIGCPIDITLL